MPMTRNKDIRSLSGRDGIWGLGLNGRLETHRRVLSPWVRDSRGGWQREGLETRHVSGPLVFFFLYAQIPIYLYSTFFYYFRQLKWFFESFDWLILAMEHLVLLFLHLPVFFWSHFPPSGYFQLRLCAHFDSFNYLERLKMTFFKIL